MTRSQWSWRKQWRADCRWWLGTELAPPNGFITARMDLFVTRRRLRNRFVGLRINPTRVLKKLEGTRALRRCNTRGMIARRERWKFTGGRWRANARSGRPEQLPQR